MLHKAYNLSADGFLYPNVFWINPCLHGVYYSVTSHEWNHWAMDWAQVPWMLRPNKTEKYDSKNIASAWTWLHVLVLPEMSWDSTGEGSHAQHHCDIPCGTNHVECSSFDHQPSAILGSLGLVGQAYQVKSVRSHSFSLVDQDPLGHTSRIALWEQPYGGMTRLKNLQANSHQLAILHAILILHGITVSCIRVSYCSLKSPNILPRITTRNGQTSVTAIWPSYDPRCRGCSSLAENRVVWEAPLRICGASVLKFERT